MRTRWSPEAVSFTLALFFVLVLNLPFWQRFLHVVEPKSVYDWTFIAAVLVSLLIVSYMIILLLAVRPLLRPIMTVLLPVTAAASYFMLEYGTIIDVNMVRNVFETDSREAGDLMTGKLLLFVAVLGVLPAVLLWMLPIEWPRPARDFRRKLKSAIVLLPIAAASLFAFLPAVTSTFRENWTLRMTLTPSNYIGGLNKYLRNRFASAPVAAVSIADDATRIAPASGTARRQVFVIVVGETARADHWSLNGYARLTTPELAKVDGLVNFPNATSCGTDTAYSVPCMFSGLGREDFTNAKAASRQNLMDVLQRTGMDVVWRENQAGCKGVCNRIPTEVLTGLKHPTFYANTENFDEILIEGLAERIRSASKDMVVVMHMMGSHGPAYWKRYPAAFEAFTPICREAQFSRCELDAIINAYDNTILYSDFVLSRLIGILKAASDEGSADTGMLYVSDHGESLGENHIYLHGMPYAFAPKAQKHVPMIVWLSPSMRKTTETDQDCLLRTATLDRSHDNLFHSVLGILNVKTAMYDPALDLFAPCRRATAVATPDVPVRKIP